MRTSALSSNEFMNLYSGSSYNSPSNKFSSTFTKGFGRNYSSPKNDSEKTITYGSKYRSDSSSKYSPKAEKIADAPSDLRSSKVRDFSTPKSQQGFSSSASGFFSSADRSQADKAPTDSSKNLSKNYTQTSSYRPPSASLMTKSTMFRDATREDANILTRKKFDIETNNTTPMRVAHENRSYSTRHSDLKDKYNDDYTPKKESATYYPLDEFLSKYSNTRTPTTANNNTQASRYNNTERVDGSAYSLAMNKINNEKLNNTQSSTSLRSSSYLSDPTKSPYSSSPRYNSYFDRHGNNNNSSKDSLKTSKLLNNVPQFEYKKFEYSRETSDYSNEKPLLTRNELALKKNSTKDTSESDSEYNKSSYRASQDTRDQYKSSAAQPAQNEEKPSLNSFITKVERGGPFQALRKFEDKFEAKPLYTNKDDSPLRLPEDDNDSPYKRPQTSTNKEERLYKTAAKSLYKDEDSNSNGYGELKKWNSKYIRTSSTRNDESTDSGVGDDSPMRPNTTYYVSHLKKHLSANNDKDYFSQIYREHFQQSFQSMKLCRYMNPTDPRALAKKKVYLAKKEIHKNKKTLVFDLDETLIHCNDSNIKRSDVKLPIRFPGGEVIEAGINVRPYAIECLKELSQFFEIIVFTASHKCYANVVLDYLDPHKQYIQHRLYRDSCVYTDEGVFVKDLRVFANRDLKDLVLIDNAAYSFGFQLENGIPIIPFYENKNDQELKHLIPYLKSLAHVKDVREVNKKTFKFHNYSQYNSMNEVFENVIC